LPDRPAAEYERALRHAEAAARQRPDDPELLFALAAALRRLDREPARARAALARAGEVWELLSQEHTSLLDRRIAAEPRNAQLLRERAEVHACHRHWAAALADFERARALDPKDHWLYFRAATLAAFLGDRERYTRISREMTKRFRASRDQLTVERTVRAALLLPGTVAPVSEPLQSLETALAKANDEVNFHDWVLYDLALAELRSGRPSAALAWIARPRKNPTAQWRKAMGLAIEAFCLGNQRPFFPQQNLYFSPLLQGHGA
jgi:hypothetical protein